MRLSTYKSEKRSAFTLVEMLVVVLIIAVLVSLLGAAVSRAMATGRSTMNRSEIGQLAAALEAFKTRYNVGYPPSRIRLCERYNDYLNPMTGQPNSQLDSDSIAFLRRMFPRIGEITVGGVSINIWQSPQPNGFIDWNGNGTLDSGGVTLQGDQCLVFFLGGIPDTPSFSSGTPGCLGFSTNPSNPTQPVGDRKAPLFDFQTNRLKGWPMATASTQPPPLNPNARSPLFYSYLDSYGTPFAYFSSGNRRNDYNRYWASGQSDCTDLARYWNYVGGQYVGPSANDSPPSIPGVAPWPYAEAWGTSPRYLAPETFQIISAGADKVFGSGSVLVVQGTPPAVVGTPPTWTKLTAELVYGTDTAGSDDQSSFHSSKLGVTE